MSAMFACYVTHAHAMASLAQMRDTMMVAQACLPCLLPPPAVSKWSMLMYVCRACVTLQCPFAHPREKARRRAPRLYECGLIG
jgi:hypothetical protein